MNNFTGAVSDHPAVIQTEVNDTRSPPRVTVVLSASEIPDGVHDVLNRFNATIEDVEADESGTLAVELTVGSEWQELTTKTTNVHGNSPCFILERPFREATGLGDGSTVRVFGRDGAIKFVRVSDGVH